MHISKTGCKFGCNFFTLIMANLKRNIIFSLENRKKDGIPIIDNVPIRMRVVFSNNRIDFSTGYRIDVAKWDFEKQKVKNGCTNKLKQSASDINSDLQKYYTQIQDIFKVFETKNINPTVELLKKSMSVWAFCRVSDLNTLPLHVQLELYRVAKVSV